MDCCTDYDDAFGISRLEHETATSQVFPHEKRRNLPNERQGEIRLHRYALRPWSGGENLRSRRCARDDARHGRTEIRRDDEEYRQPIAARPQPQDDNDGFRRENQLERHGKSRRQGQFELELQHRRDLRFRHAEHEIEVRRQGRRNHQTRRGRLRVVPVEFEPCARCVEPVWSAHRLAIRQIVASDRRITEKNGLEKRFVAWRRADDTL